MRSEDMPMADPPARGLGRTAASRGQRPWLLIAAALLLAVLSALLWAKWRDSRTRADQLQAELKQVYTEAESLRTQATQAQQRITQLERELRALSTGEGGRDSRQGVKPKRSAP
jgi:septal ring factor EnvC (AmiA/AmiB activator)